VLVGRDHGVTVVAPRVLHTADGVVLEAEWAPPKSPVRGTVVCCHPHPQFGGTMRSLVISALFEALPALGYGCLRFNFRGVEGSSGEYTAGGQEPEDVRAAVSEVVADAGGRPLTLVGWSFGADMALSVADPAVAGWVGIAPPLRFGTADESVAHDPRPKHLVLAQHDEFRAPAEVQAEVAPWSNTTTEVVPGASHFFIGRTDRVITATADFLRSLEDGDGAEVTR
jgi:alpha/beta superfamily hydrolase